MSQSIEIEFKNELTKAEYDRVKTHFKLPNSLFFKQENHYFDTADFALKEAGSAVRIRKKHTAYELTLKQPIKDGLLETNQVLTEAEALNAIDQNKIPEGQVVNLMKKMNIDLRKVQFFGTLTTVRAEWKFKDGLLVLDYSTYLDKADYELEYEVTDPIQGKAVFVELLTSLQIPIRKTENKIKRFYLRKYQELSTDSSFEK